MDASSKNNSLVVGLWVMIKKTVENFLPFSKTPSQFGGTKADAKEAERQTFVDVV